MEGVVHIASYISKRYEQTFGEPVGEMKLHKLLYFSQRECFVQLGEPMFPEMFEAWRYGPVMVEIRQLFKYGRLCNYPKEQDVEKYVKVFDKVFSSYAPKDAWSLSALTHGEYSWSHARKLAGVGTYDLCNYKIQTSDIAIDADRIKTRRFLLKALCV